MTFSSGLDRVRLFSNFLMLVLLAGNIFFSIQYTTNEKLLQDQTTAMDQKDQLRLQTAQTLKFFIDTVLVNQNATISYDDRVKLEDDIRQLHDDVLNTDWDNFVASKDSKTAQDNAVKVLSRLSLKML